MSEHSNAALLFLYATRIINILMFVPKLGSIHRISLLIVQEVFAYLLMLLLILLIFAMLFYSLFFNENQAFESYIMSVRTAFDFMIGNVDFGLFNDETGEGMWVTFL